MKKVRGFKFGFWVIFASKQGRGRLELGFFGGFRRVLVDWRKGNLENLYLRIFERMLILGGFWIYRRD